MAEREVFSDNDVEFGAVRGVNYVVKGDNVYRVIDYSKPFVVGERVEDKKIIADVRGQITADILPDYREMYSKVARDNRAIVAENTPSAKDRKTLLGEEN